MTLGSSCFESCKTKRKFLRAKTERRGGWGKEKGNLIKVVAYSSISNSKHVRPKPADVNTACSLTSVVNICSGIGFHPHSSTARHGIDEYAFNHQKQHIKWIFIIYLSDKVNTAVLWAPGPQVKLYKQALLTQTRRTFRACDKFAVKSLIHGGLHKVFKLN